MKYLPIFEKFSSLQDGKNVTNVNQFVNYTVKKVRTIVTYILKGN